jgi:release factor glutamine methyltransferase
VSGPAPTLHGILRTAERRLRESGIDAPRLDARLLVAAALRAAPDSLRFAPDRALSGDEARRIERALARRIGRREPVSRILAHREFWSLDFRITPDVLDPRPDSETLVEAALAAFADRRAPLRVLDLGTGSGCLLLAVLHERPLAQGLGVDISDAALRVAAANARRLGLGDRADFRSSNWGAGIDARFDLVLCNPPYIAESERPALAPEVIEHDPPGALFAGADGLDAYRAVLPGLARLLAPGGAAAFEIGARQAAAVRAIAEDCGLAVGEVRRDLAGRDRCVVLRAA